MLIREEPATELTVATRILARAGALADDGRIALRLNDVVYVGARGVSIHTMTPYDVAVVLLDDGAPLAGVAPDDVADYLAALRSRPGAAGVARAPDRAFVAARSLRGCAVALLRRLRGDPRTEDESLIERTWLDLVADARVSGALIGAFPQPDAPA